MRASRRRVLATTTAFLALGFAPAMRAGTAQSGLEARGLSEGVFLRLGRTPWITLAEAEASEVVYVLIDTECPWCHRLMTQLQRDGARVRVQVRYVLVAVLGDESLPRAAAILDSDNRRGALAALLSGKHAAGRGSTDSRAAIATNNVLMRALDLPATPGLVYRDAGGAIRALAGMPDPRAYEQIFHIGR